MRQANITRNRAIHRSEVRNDNDPQQSWENEGGNTQRNVPQQRPAVLEHRAPINDATEQETAAVDAVQDEVMAASSSEGHPPPRAWRLAGWHWLAIVVPLLAVLGGLVWVALAVGFAAAALALVLLAVMVGAAAPVWGAGLLRGREERAARIEASAQLQVQDRLSRPRTALNSLPRHPRQQPL